MHGNSVLTAISMCVCSAATHLYVSVWKGVHAHAHDTGRGQPDSHKVQPRRRRLRMQGVLAMLFVKFTRRQWVDYGVPPTLLCNTFWGLQPICSFFSPLCQAEPTRLLTPTSPTMTDGIKQHPLQVLLLSHFQPHIPLVFFLRCVNSVKWVTQRKVSVFSKMWLPDLLTLIDSFNTILLLSISILDEDRCDVILW